MTTIDGLPCRFDLFDSGAIAELVLRLESGYSLPIVVALLGGRYSQTVYDERKSAASPRYLTFYTDVSEYQSNEDPALRNTFQSTWITVCLAQCRCEVITCYNSRGNMPRLQILQ